MTGNSVHSKLIQLAPQSISLSDFQDMLESSSRSNPIRVQWETLAGDTDYYWMYWNPGAYVGGDAGGSETKAKEDMVNIQCLDVKGNWRTLDYSSVSKCRYNGKTYKVK